MRTLHLGPEELLVAAKIAVQHDDTADRGRPRDQRRRGPYPRRRADRPRIYLEPDIYSEARGHGRQETGGDPGRLFPDTGELTASTTGGPRRYRSPAVYPGTTGGPRRYRAPNTVAGTGHRPATSHHAAVGLRATGVTGVDS